MHFSKAALLAGAVFFWLTGSAFAAEPSPAASATPPEWLSPFCAVSVYAMPWKLDASVPASEPSSTVFRLKMRAESGGTLDAHVTLIGSTDAFDVHVSALALTGTEYDFSGKPLLVKLPAADTIRYAYVDSYSIEGGQSVTCPTYVRAVSVWKPDSANDHIAPPAESDVLGATELQKLPALSCGDVYTQARYVKGSGNVHVGFYGNSQKMASVHVFLDSNGNVVKAYLYKSSGVAGVDAAALGSAEKSTFKPATFLCTPVVSDYLFRFGYGTR